MSLTNYFLKSNEITLLDTLIVAILSVFIVSALKQTVIFCWRVTVSSISKIKNVLIKTIPSLYKKIKEKYNYRQNLKSGEISFTVYTMLLLKHKQGTISKLEKKALDANEEKYKEKYKMIISNEDFNKLIDLNRVNPRI